MNSAVFTHVADNDVANDVTGNDVMTSLTSSIDDTDKNVADHVTVINDTDNNVNDNDVTYNNVTDYGVSDLSCRYKDGGVASGFNHVDRNKFEKKLFRVKGKRYPRSTQVHICFIYFTCFSCCSSLPVWRSGQSVGLGIERSRVRNSPVPSGSSLRQGN